MKYPFLSCLLIFAPIAEIHAQGDLKPTRDHHYVFGHRALVSVMSEGKELLEALESDGKKVLNIFGTKLVSGPVVLCFPRMG